MSTLYLPPGPRLLLLGSLILTTALLGPPSASAFPQVGSVGEGAGQIEKPAGVAVDTETKKLYVSDAGNHRVDVFDAETGTFEFAFGWHVNKEAPEEKLQTCTIATGCQKGSSGSGPGQFDEPHAIAVDNEAASLSHHDVYVYDGGNTRVEKFSPGGVFPLPIGGEGECQFASDFEAAHPLAVGSGGTVYVGNSSYIESKEGFKVQAEKFDPSGACIEAISLAEFKKGEDFGGGGVGGAAGHLWMAVDSVGHIYASFFTNSGSPVREYEPDGTQLGTVGPSRGISAGGSLAIDPSDDLFVGIGHTIEEFNSSGDELRVFGYGKLRANPEPGLAPFHSPSGEIFVAEIQSSEPNSGRTLYLPFPPPGPIVLPEPKPEANPVGNTKATLDSQINPEGKETHYHAEYLTEAEFQKNLEEGHPGFQGAKRGPASEGEDPSLPADFKVHNVSLEIGCSEPSKLKVEEGKCLKPETKYRFRIAAKSSDGEGEGPVEGEAFTTEPPIKVIASWSSEVGAEEATLNAEVNPFGIPATGFFEYVTDAQFQETGFAGASKTATIDLGAAEEPTVASAEVGELEPATTYRYRLNASDLFVEGKLGEEEAFTTFASGAESRLPDNRAYEKVSPLEKNSGEVGVPSPSGGGAEFSVEPQQASADGAHVTYTSFAAFGEDPKSAPAASQYLSSLGPPFWSSENVNPPFEEGFTRDPFVGFSEDLSHAALIAIEPALTEDATVGWPNLYVRDSETRQLTAITTKGHEPQFPGESTGSRYCLAYGGASADFGHVFFAAFGAALDEGDPKGEGFNLYEWSPGKGLALASVLPNGNGAVPQEDTQFGPPISDAKTNSCMPAQHLMRNAISSDGSHAIWSYAGSIGTAKEPLLDRIDGSETVRLDEPNEGVSGKGGQGRYWDASADGSKVFFTDTEKLTADSGASPGKPDLYRYDFALAPKHRLTDLTPAGSEAADVSGVIGASRDGAFAYFGSGGDLYAWHEGEGARLVAEGADGTDWALDPTTQSARVSPDGQSLAFLSSASPTGYDNTVGAGEHCRVSSLEEDSLVGSPACAEAYLYSYKEDSLICASCNPSGERPLGPTRLPAWSTPYQQPRYLADDGGRLFFDTLDALLPADTNEKRDVYEFERKGTGGCAEGSPTLSAASGGCLYLISSGRPSGQTTAASYLLDASASGDGVFLSTRQQLLPTDSDERYDVYDARVGGVSPPPPPVICEGSCPGAGGEEGDFPGPGHISAPPPAPRIECPKGTRRVTRKGREACAKPKKQRHRHHRKPKPKRGAGK